ncbi:MAG: hypothetical protein FJ271_07480 [Planctomycetes bacterium]|nr:hypothetical protein [Planctomycetota bacterium]
MNISVPPSAAAAVDQPNNWVPPLRNGDRLTRDEFERRYQGMPEHIKAELIEGVVYMSSPVRIKSHGEPNSHLGGWLTMYQAFTPRIRIGSKGLNREHHEFVARLGQHR